MREAKIQQATGRLVESHPTVAHCSQIGYDSSGRSLLWSADGARQAKPEELAGSCLLRATRQDLNATTDVRP